ncbi:MAG TPA: hypothetical protein VKX29_06250 [Brumimicrobium sp.]|nr:hypothetical protein [Brumimicrobium sp.]
MAKWGTYFILAALFTIVLPFILMIFEAFSISENPIFPFLSLLFGGLGVVLHLINIIRTGEINTSSIILLTSILLLIYGFSLNVLDVPNAHYLLLVGTLLIALWIMLPGSKAKK